jgi:hypothetical protein
VLFGLWFIECVLIFCKKKEPNMKIIKPLIALLVLGLTSVSVHADTLSIALKERLSFIENAWNQGQADKLVKEIYLPQTQIAGEGSDDLYEGVSVSNLVSELVKDNKMVKLQLIDVQALANDAALSWVQWHVTPTNGSTPAFDMKSLFVWKRSHGQWRIVADMYTSGNLPKNN